jgi:hypothetical protein
MMMMKAEEEKSLNHRKEIRRTEELERLSKRLGVQQWSKVWARPKPISQYKISITTKEREEAATLILTETRSEGKKSKLNRNGR